MLLFRRGSGICNTKEKKSIRVLDKKGCCSAVLEKKGRYSRMYFIRKGIQTWCVAIKECNLFRVANNRIRSFSCCSKGVSTFFVLEIMGFDFPRVTDKGIRSSLCWK